MDKAETISKLRSASARARKSCENVPDVTWYERPAPGGFSMSDVVEHMAEANALILGALHRALDKGPRSQPFSSLADEEVFFAYDRAGEPPGSKPSPYPLTQDEALGRMDDSVEAIARWSDGVDVDLRDYGLTHPAYGSLDGVQWILMAVSHIEQHRSDIMVLKQASVADRL